ncbi:crotonobetaine/carnitine-CoA ligase [Sphingopyxis panaciterrae]|nr:AMP-binding protein [Sphingopyxis panaciterrae]NIJ37718.1 crotonobetaine/carnitine-CoA ligase [Sphingopyxis panaciterrae]
MENLVTLLRAAAEQWPDAEALRFDATGEALSFSEFDRQSGEMAAGLVAAGIGPGDRVAVCSANHSLFPLAWFATIKAGAIMVPVNIGYRAEDARHILEHAEPAALFCDADRVTLFDGLRGALPSLRLLVTPDDAGVEGWQTLAELVARGAETISPIIERDDITNIQFTSGTSGLPKGCMLSHAYWIELARSVDEEVKSLAAGETMLTAQAFSYLDPQWAFVLTLMKGGRLVVLDRFRPSELWSKIAHYDARFFYCLAAMPLMLLSRPPSPAEREHRLGAIMCSAIPADRHREMEERFAVPWVEAYGSTETGSDLGVRWPDHAATVGMGTIGKPLPRREAMLVDEAFGEVPRGEAGELLVRSPAMMKGYWRNDAATREVFHEGWYRTGDMARQDPNGYYYLVGRRKDMIRRGGENIAANEVETILQQHPAVLLAACIAVPDALRNEEVKAFIVPRRTVGAAELADFLQDRIAGFKIPRYWAFVEALPMTPSERVAKPKLSRDVGEGVHDLQSGVAAVPPR